MGGTPCIRDLEALQADPNTPDQDKYRSGFDMSKSGRICELRQYVAIIMAWTVSQGLDSFAAGAASLDAKVQQVKTREKSRHRTVTGYVDLMMKCPNDFASCNQQANCLRNIVQDLQTVAGARAQLEQPQPETAGVLATPTPIKKMSAAFLSSSRSATQPNTSQSGHSVPVERTLFPEDDDGAQVSEDSQRQQLTRTWVQQVVSKVQLQGEAAMQAASEEVVASMTAAARQQMYDCIGKTVPQGQKIPTAYALFNGYTSKKRCAAAMQGDTYDAMQHSQTTGLQYHSLPLESRIKWCLYRALLKLHTKDAAILSEQDASKPR